LTTDDARGRLGEVGPNEPARAARAAGLVQILLLMANPLVIILLLASAASAILGERVNASIIVLMVALSVVLNFVQTYRSHRVAERLRDAVAPTATALRDGTWTEIRRRALVPGDIVRLAAGDRVPADARLLEARDLHVQQAALTGESMPAEKDADDSEVAPRQPADARNVVFLGTSVVSGTATALVVATGPATAFGDIAARLSTRPPETEFERGTRQFALLIMRTVFFLVLFVLLAGALLHHAFLEAMRARCEATYRDLSAQGSRVLAVAYAVVPLQTVYSARDEHGLVLAGFVTFFDPPMEGVAETLRALRRDGVEVKILTGDNELVVHHVCGQVGLESARIVGGDEIERMTDSALAAVAEQTTVFARVSPAQKNRIILALKSRNHVVGFLGDGINDAPSIHTADVGVSVATAVDVAKDAADIILLERDLNVLHAGILEGRRAFGNVMKYLLMGTSSNFGNMFSMAGAFLFLPFLPMLPTQILLNNFLYDLAQITIPTDNVDDAFIRTPQRWNIGIIQRFMVVIGPISSIYDFLTFGVLLWVFRASEALFQTGWFVESLATQTLVLFVIRTAGNPLRSRPSLPLAVTTVLVVLVGVILPFTPLAATLGFVPLPGAYFVFLGGVTMTYLVLVELVKRRLMRKLLGTGL
jgi:magnesium-transporting ATPase (P-type)